MNSYLIDGQVVRLLSKLDDGKFLVQTQVRAWADGEEYYDDGELRIVKAVYDKPPTHLIDAEIAKRKEELADLRREIDLAEKLRIVALEESARRAEKFKRYKALERIEAFIDGKITHFAVIPYSGVPRIIDGKAKLGDGDQHGRPSTKLLTLFGKSSGDLEWRINAYSDGSGSNELVYPCQSEQEALSKIQEWIDGPTPNERYKIENKVEAAKRFGLHIDPAIVAVNAKYKRDSLLERMAKLEEMRLEISLALAGEKI